jgi:hypothetical protein
MDDGFVRPFDLQRVMEANVQNFAHIRFATFLSWPSVLPPGHDASKPQVESTNARFESLQKGRHPFHRLSVGLRN